MARKTDYKIGYGKPPVHTQWKKGQSGNPKGRTRRSLEIGPAVAKFLGERVVVRVGRTTVRMTRLQHLVRNLFERALRGDPRVLKLVFDEARKHEAQVEAQMEETPEVFTAADKEVLAGIYARIARDVRERDAAQDSTK